MLDSDLNTSEGSLDGVRAKKAWATPTIEDSTIGGGTEVKVGAQTEAHTPTHGTSKVGS
jgi:hypothetical protein